MDGSWAVAALGATARGSALRLRKAFAQGLGDFFWLWLKILSKHIKASSDDTGDRP